MTIDVSERQESRRELFFNLFSNVLFSCGLRRLMHGFICVFLEFDRILRGSHLNATTLLALSINTNLPDCVFLVEPDKVVPQEKKFEQGHGHNLKAAGPG